MSTQVRRLTDEVLITSLTALDAGWVTTDDLRRAYAWRNAQRPQLGRLALVQGKLTMSQVFEVLGRQSLHGGVFGKVAVDLGFLNKSDVYDLLQAQAQLTPTLADALVALELLTPQQATAVSLTNNDNSGAIAEHPLVESPLV